MKKALTQTTVKVRVAPYTIYHWDTFDNETIPVDTARTLQSAIKKVNKRYEGRIALNGADRVDIVDKAGNVVWHRNVC